MLFQCTMSLGACGACSASGSISVTANALVKSASRYRVVQAAARRPFIGRDMSAAVTSASPYTRAREYPGPACYEFTGRGFNINVDTPYDGTRTWSRGRVVAVAASPHVRQGRSPGIEHVFESRVDRGTTWCSRVRDVCPVDALARTDHFEQAHLGGWSWSPRPQPLGRGTSHVRRLRGAHSGASGAHGYQ